MTVIALASVAGAPGVTTAATALAVHWPRPVLLIEADIRAVSTMMPGFFRANLLPSDGGIEKLAFAASRNVLEAEDLLNPAFATSIAMHELPPIPERPIPAIPEGHKMWVIPGFVNLAVADGVHGLWAKLPRLLVELGDAGIDVIVDLGHLSVDDSRLAIVDTADRVLIGMSSTMIDLNRAHRRLQLPDLATRTRALAGERYWILLNTPVAQSIPAKDFSAHLIPVIGTLPFDPSGAAVFSHGQPDSKPARNSYRSGIRRLAQDLPALSARDQRSAG